MATDAVAWRYRYHAGGEWKLAKGPGAQWAADHPGFEEEPLYTRSRQMTMEQIAAMLVKAGISPDDPCEHHLEIVRLTEAAHGIEP